MTTETTPPRDCPESCECLCDPCVIFGTAAHHGPDGPTCYCDPCTDGRIARHKRSPGEQAFDKAAATEAAAIQRRSDQGYAATYGAPPPTIAPACPSCGWFRGHHMSCRTAGALTVTEGERS